MPVTWPDISLQQFVDPNSYLGATVLAMAMLLCAWIASALLTRIIRRSSWVMGRLGHQVDETMLRQVMRLKGVLVYFCALVVYASLVPGLRALMGTLMASAGILALVVGISARSTLANLVSGVALAIYRPFRIGDRVQLDNEYGTVEDITLRHTIVRTWEHKRLVIPNEKIDNMTIVNYSIVDPRMLCRVELGVSYDTDLDLARRLILEEAQRCPYRLASADPPWVRVAEFKDSAVGLRLGLWTRDQDEAWQARFWMLEQVKKRFDREGVEIPFPYRTLVYKKDLPPAREEGQAGPPGPKPPTETSA
ncbi:MAG: mechanosensitive ion channel family protein [Desulfarculus sp.]|jgi:small-conductance mechanosensitive channel|nr:MAG: mechanosensitive ion channel family protein [Desulfarculus sp.]